MQGEPNDDGNENLRDSGDSRAPVRLIAETALDLVARRLRMLGYDVETRPGLTLEALYREAEATRRTVLTTSRRLPVARAHVPCVVVPPNDAKLAVRRVADRFVAVDPPFTRCPCCNVRLQREVSATARGRVPDSVVERWALLRRCPRCERWFWPGGHLLRLRAWLERALDRPLTDGPDP
jgi:hypothetical protein